MSLHVCLLRDGFVNCTKLDQARDCPRLSCGAEQRLLEEGTCCPVCRGQWTSRYYYVE